MTGRIIKQQQDLPARHVVAPPCRPRLQPGRDLRRRDPGGQQQARQRVGRVDRPLPAGMGVQRQEKLPSGKFPASWCAACTAKADTLAQASSSAAMRDSFAAMTAGRLLSVFGVPLGFIPGLGFPGIRSHILDPAVCEGQEAFDVSAGQLVQGNVGPLVD
jgi:hypothetical protein